MLFLVLRGIHVACRSSQARKRTLESSAYSAKVSPVLSSTAGDSRSRAQRRSASGLDKARRRQSPGCAPRAQDNASRRLGRHAMK
jgi:hypothetical protein